MWMRRVLPLMLILIFVSACGDDDDPAENQNQNQNQNQNNGEGPAVVDPSTDSEDLLTAIDDYTSWDHFAGNDSPEQGGHPNDVWVVSYANEGAQDSFADDIVPYPEGSIIVKEEYVEEDGDAAFVTVMEKIGEDMGEWYWMKATADLEKIIDHPDAGPLEGSGDDSPPGCVGCHGDAGEPGDHDFVTFHRQEYGE